jgi:hypothetical protein
MGQADDYYLCGAFFRGCTMGYPETGLQMGTVVEHETGNSTAKAEQNAV